MNHRELDEIRYEEKAMAEAIPPWSDEYDDIRTALAKRKTELLFGEEGKR